MDIFGTSSKIEEIESDVEETTEQLQEVQNRDNKLQEAVEQLQQDIETSNILKEKKIERSEEKKELSERIDDYKSKVQELENQVNEAIEANEDSASILHSLELLGEEVQEGLEILADRQLVIEKCKEQLAEIMEKLNMAASFSESSSAVSSEAASNRGESKARNPFIESLRYDTSGNERDKKDPSTSSSSEDTAVTGQQERERTRTTDWERDDGLISNICNAWNGMVNNQSEPEESDDTAVIRNQILAGSEDPCISQFGWRAKQKEYTLEEDLKEVNPGFYTGDERKTRNCQRCVIAFEARLRGADVRATDRILNGTDTLPIMNHPDGWPSCFKNPVLTPCFGNTGLDTGTKVLGEMKNFGDGARAIVRVQWHNTITVKGSDGKKHSYIVDTSSGTPVLKDLVTRTTVNPNSVFPGHDLSDGFMIREITNPFNPNMKEVQLVSKKSGTSLAVVKGGGGHVFTAIQKGGKTIFCEPQSGCIIQRPELYFAAAKSDMTHVMRIDNLEFSERAKDCCQSV